MTRDTKGMGHIACRHDGTIRDWSEVRRHGQYGGAWWWCRWQFEYAMRIVDLKVMSECFLLPETYGKIKELPPCLLDPEHL